MIGDRANRLGEPWDAAARPGRLALPKAKRRETIAINLFFSAQFYDGMEWFELQQLVRGRELRGKQLLRRLFGHLGFARPRHVDMPE